MKHSGNIAVVRRLYAARGNPDSSKRRFTMMFAGRRSRAMPYGGVHLDFDALVRDFFTPLFRDFCDWVTAPEE